jgi:hypothetical protein
MLIKIATSVSVSMHIDFSVILEETFANCSYNESTIVTDL